MSALNVAVPLAVSDVDWSDSFGHMVFEVDDDEALAQAVTMFQVPTMSPPQAATFPQVPPAASEPLLLLHPRNTTPIAKHALNAFIEILPV